MILLWQLCILAAPWHNLPPSGHFGYTQHRAPFKCRAPEGLMRTAKSLCPSPVFFFAQDWKGEKLSRGGNIQINIKLLVRQKPEHLEILYLLQSETQLYLQHLVAWSMIWGFNCGVFVCLVHPVVSPQDGNIGAAMSPTKEWPLCQRALVWFGSMGRGKVSPFHPPQIPRILHSKAIRHSR